MKALSSILFFAIVFIFSSCTKEKVSPSTFVQWVNSDKSVLTESKEVNGIVITVKVLPSEYQAFQEIGVTTDKITFQKKHEELSGLQYFKLTFSTTAKGNDMLRHGISNDDEYQKRLHYFSFGMKQNLKLESNGILQEPALYHFERSFDLTDHTAIMVAYNKPSSISTDQVLILNDNTFGIGKIKFKISKDIEEQLPVIKF